MKKNKISNIYVQTYTYVFIYIVYSPPINLLLASKNASVKYTSEYRMLMQQVVVTKF